MICRITYIVTDGVRIVADAVAGGTVMTTARRASVPGIEGKCRGNGSCVTCHVHVHPSWMKAVGKPSVMEDSMLDFADDVDATSRLACQIPVSAELDGLEVFVPGHQRTLGL